MESIHDLRRRVLEALPCRDELLLNLIDALAVGPRPATPSEVVLSPLWGFAAYALFGPAPGGRCLDCGRAAPGAVRRVALGLLVKLGITPPQPQVRGKSPGRAVGTRLEPRKRYRIFRKRGRRAAA